MTPPTDKPRGVPIPAEGTAAWDDYQAARARAATHREAELLRRAAPSRAVLRRARDLAPDRSLGFSDLEMAAREILATLEPCDLRVAHLGALTGRWPLHEIGSDHPMSDGRLGAAVTVAAFGRTRVNGRRLYVGQVISPGAGLLVGDVVGSTMPWEIRNRIGPGSWGIEFLTSSSPELSRFRPPWRAAA